jgi:hypothetical protein
VLRSGELAVALLTTLFFVPSIAKSLAGWKNVNAKVYQPSLSSIEGSRDNLVAFVDALFEHSPSELQRRNLVGFRDAMAANLIMTFKAMYSEYRENVVVTTMVEKMKALSLTINDIYAWGEAIRADYQLNNLIARCGDADDAMEEGFALMSQSESCGSGFLTDRLALLTCFSELSNLTQEGKEGRAQIDMLSKQLNHVTSILQRIENAVGLIPIDGTPNKRRRVSVPADNVNGRRVSIEQDLTGTSVSHLSAAGPIVARLSEDVAGVSVAGVSVAGVSVAGVNVCSLVRRDIGPPQYKSELIKMPLCEAVETMIHRGMNLITTLYCNSYDNQKNSRVKMVIVAMKQSSGAEKWKVLEDYSTKGQRPRPGDAGYGTWIVTERAHKWKVEVRQKVLDAVLLLHTTACDAVTKSNELGTKKIGFGSSKNNQRGATTVTNFVGALEHVRNSHNKVALPLPKNLFE